MPLFNLLRPGSSLIRGAEPAVNADATPITPLGAPVANTTAAPANIFGVPVATTAATPISPLGAPTAPPLYESLTAQSTPDQIAAAYKDYISNRGGDTQTAQTIAANYLGNLGVAAPTVQDAYKTFQSQQAKDAVESLYQKYAGRASDPEGLAFWAEKFGPSVDADEAELFQRSILENTAKGLESNVTNTDWWKGLGADQKINLYNQANVTPDQLQKLGVTQSDIDWMKQNGYFGLPSGWESYTPQQKIEYFNASGFTPDQILKGGASQKDIDWMNQHGYAGDKVTKSFGANPENAATNAYFLANPDVAAAYAKDPMGKTPDQFAMDHYLNHGSSEGRTAPPLVGILSGFEALGRGDFTEDQAKKFLGENKFNDAKQAFQTTIKSGIGDILADKKLSGEEAISAVQTARKYGLDNDELAALTGYDKKLFDTINQGYDATAGKVIKSSLESATTDADRLKTGLALQSKYGFSDEDLAKATGYDTKQIKDWFEPVRNFGEEYKTVLTKPDTSGKEILSFLDKAKQSPSVGLIYGDNIAALEGKINELNQKWGGLDGYQAENIYNQINQITKAVGGKNWTGSWSGSGGDSATRAAVGVLMGRGVDNLSDLAVAPTYKKTPANLEFYNGNRVYTDEEGKKYTLSDSPSGEGFVPVNLPKNAKTVPGVSLGEGDEGEVFRPLTAEELKTYDPKTKQFDVESGKKLIDKSTGKTIAEQKRGFFGMPIGGSDNKFVLHSYETGNALKSEYKEFGIIMTDNGVPVPYQTSQKDGLIYSPILPIAASFLLPGVGTAISGALSGTVGTGLLNTALTQGIMSGGVAALTGNHVGKSFVGGAIGAPIAQGISSLLPAGMDPNVARFATNVGTNLARGAIMGTPANLQGSLINAGVQYGASQLPWNLTPQQVNLLAGIATPLLQGQSIDPVRLGGILTNYAIKSQQPQKGA